VEKFCKAEPEGPKRDTCLTQPGAAPVDVPAPNNGTLPPPADTTPKKD